MSKNEKSLIILDLIILLFCYTFSNINKLIFTSEVQERQRLDRNYSKIKVEFRKIENRHILFFV